MSYHSHENRDEVWTILSGKGTLILEGEKRCLEAGDTVEIKSLMKHSIIADFPLVLLETQVGEEITESDKIKYEYHF